MEGLAMKPMYSMVLCVIIVIFYQQYKICMSEKQTALFIFGDSLFDVGNNNFIKTIPFLQANYAPYGHTFARNATGRFSDGRVIPDFIAQYADLPLLPPYMDVTSNHVDYVHGVNFASAGAGALVETRHGTVSYLIRHDFSLDVSQFFRL